MEERQEMHQLKAYRGARGSELFRRKRCLASWIGRGIHSLFQGRVWRELKFRTGARFYNIVELGYNREKEPPHLHVINFLLVANFLRFHIKKAELRL